MPNDRVIAASKILAKDMRDCINAIEDRDVYSFSDYELRGFKQTYLNMRNANGY